MKGHVDVIKFLATKIENPNAPLPCGWKPIHLAAANGHAETVKYLVMSDEHFNAPVPDGRTSLKLAAQNQHAEVGKILLEQITYKWESNPQSFLATLM